MSQVRKEFLVGLLVIGVVILMGVFAWLMGVFQPFSNSFEYHLRYRFAGGVETGSPVRVAGVKVGKVDSIEFLPSAGDQEGAPLRITISVSKIAAPSVRQDSRFYVNMAGIIGERYIEITPGTPESPPLADGAEIRGVDPPRIDQLLSQGYGVFGRLQELLEDNEETLAEFMKELPKVLAGMTDFLKKNDWKKLTIMMDNLTAITTDMRVITKKFHNPETQETLDKLYEMVDRAYQIDPKTLKKFLQEEGIRARIF